MLSSNCRVSIRFLLLILFASLVSAQTNLPSDTSHDRAGQQTLSSSEATASTTNAAKGMFILDPPSRDTDCPGVYMSSCYSKHLIPTLICTGKGTPAGYNCTQAGAGEPYVKGAVFYIRWDFVSPSNGTYDFRIPDNRMKPWTDSGKVVSFDFIPTSQERVNNVTPSWYLKPIKISSVSQTHAIITLQTTTDMGFFPGGVQTAAGLEIQITGTGTALDGNGTSSSPGIWTVCNHITPGCADPSAQKITAIGSGSDIAAVSSGAVGNPVYGSTGGPCGSGTLPIEWRPNFIRAWQEFMKQALAHYGSNSNVAYLRFGLGIGGENIPNHGTNVSACQSQMTKYGFTRVAAPWPAPTSSQWPNVSANWIAYVKKMLLFEDSLSSSKVIATTISPIETYGDYSTPDTTAANAVAAGLGFGNQGMQKSDPTNYAAGLPCLGGNWCANFEKYSGQVPLELQTLDYSDPTDVSVTGSLANTLPFALTRGAQILELYVDDWMCTFDGTWNNRNKYAACALAGYPAVFEAAAAQIN